MNSTPNTNSTKTKMKNLSLIGAGAAGVAALTIGAAGIAGAQEDDPVLVDPPAEEVQEDDGETRQERRQNRRENRQERLEARVDALVEDGVLTEEQAENLDEVRAALQAEREAIKAEKMEALADALGITVEELTAAREEGTSLSELAGDNIDAVVDLFVERKTERINEAVENGRITQEQADERLEGLEDRVQSRIEDGGGFGRRGGPARGGFDRGEAPADAVESSFDA